MNRFVANAKGTQNGSPVMSGKTKISTEEIIAKYPEGITITAVDIITKRDGTSYPVFNFGEDESKYYNGGTIARQVVDGWLKLDAYKGDIVRLNEDIKNEPPKFKVYKSTTKSGRPLIAFDGVED